MGHDTQVRSVRRRLPRALAAAVLTAGALAVGLPAGPALAAAAAPSTPVTSLAIATSARVLGHTWTLGLSVGEGQVEATLGTTIRGVSEEHSWLTTEAFTAMGLKELKATSTGHATWKTGSSLSPVLAASVTFTPTKATKEACASGSETVYSGKVSGTVSLATGLRAVKVRVRFTGQPVGVLTVDKACTFKGGRIFCSGSLWILASTNTNLLGIQLLGTKPPWLDDFGVGGLKTASKWVTRSVGVLVNGSAPKLNAAAKTLSVSGASSGITGAAVISFSDSVTQPPQPPCFVGAKKYKETSTVYFNSRVKITKPFQAHSLLAGTLKLPASSTGSYTDDRLTAA